MLRYTSTSTPKEAIFLRAIQLVRVQPGFVVLFLLELLRQHLELLTDVVLSLLLQSVTGVTWQQGKDNPETPHLPVHQSQPDQQSVLKPCWQADLSLGPARCTSVTAQAPSDRLVVVLDLDETLICSYRPHSVPSHLQIEAARQRAGVFEVDCRMVGGSTGRMVVYTRPGLQEFLTRVSRFAELVIFTAAQPSYAAPLLDVLDPEFALFSERLYRGATTRTQHKEYVKDLSRLGRDLRRTVLVDNNPASFLLQPLNGLHIADFRGDPDDDQLLSVVLPFLEQLAAAEDVTQVIKQRFHTQP